MRPLGNDFPIPTRPNRAEEVSFTPVVDHDPARVLPARTIKTLGRLQMKPISAEQNDEIRLAIDETGRRQSALSPLLSRSLSFDFAAGRSLYLSEAGDLVKAEIVPLCSYGKNTATCQWAWANPEVRLPDSFSQVAFKKLGAQTGLEMFASNSPFPTTETELRGLLALIVVHLGGLGLVEKESEEAFWSFLVVRLERDSSAIQLSEETAPGLLTKLLSLDAVSAFNAVRARWPVLVPMLAGADLRGDPQPWRGDLHAQIPFDQGYVAEYQPRILDGINFSNCRLDGANLRGVSLKQATFASASMVDADFTGADLHNADFRGAFLNGTNFTAARLAGVSFAGAELGRTLLLDTDLSETSGLDETNHSTSSEISFSTLVKSGFQVDESFLRATGVSIGLIDDLRRGKRFGGEYATCFLSYSTKDTAFVQRLYYALQEVGVRVFWDCKNVDAAETLDEQLVKAIREHDRTLAIFSENSLKSKWLKREVDAALYYKANGFTPLRLCEVPPIQTFEARVANYRILDFSGWENEAAFNSSLQGLLTSIHR